MSESSNMEKQPLTEKRTSSPPGSSSMDCCLAHIKTTSRLCGMGVLAVMWAATVTTLRGDYSLPTYVGYYLLAASIFVSFFEITWMLDKMVCCVREGCCCRCWSVILWVDGWRKFVLYTALSVPLFLQGLDGVFHVICGFCLLVLACLYLLKSFASLRGDKQSELTSVQIQQPTTQDGNQVAASVRHEMSTQTDVTSTSAEKKPVPPNPFDETEDEEDTADKAVEGREESRQSEAKSDDK